MTLFKTLCAAGLLLVAVTACSKASAGTETINAKCPIMQDPVEADGGTVQWHDKTVGFCCDGCPEKFEKLSDAEQKAALVAVGAKVD